LLFVVFCGAGGCRLTGVIAGSVISNAVDVYNSASGTWSTAQLSVARRSLAATSVGSVAIFAGGVTPGNFNFHAVCLGAAVWVDACGRWCDVCVFEAWGLLFVVFCCAGGCRLMGVTVDSYSNAVDLYNSASGTWSTAQLSEVRFGLAATSVGSVAIFAGGDVDNCSFHAVC
jgi:hypothetical protein